MSLKSQARILLQIIVNFANKDNLGPGKRANQTIDSLYPEIRQLEKKLATAPTRPSQVVRGNSRMLEPMTEQQKIMDISG